MDDPRMLWLSVTNALLGAVVLVCLLGFAYAVASGIAEKLKRHFAHPINLHHGVGHLPH
jgi:hypothetical protein